MSDLDNDLSRTLQQHAESLSATPLAFDDVRGKATSIRRRRQLATGLGVAAAIAVIVPTAMFATRGTSSDGQLPPATQPSTATDTSSPSPTSTPTMGSNPHAIDVSDLPTGAPPAAPVLGDNDIALAQTSEAVVRWTKDGTISVEAAGQTFGPYTTSHGMVPNPAATTVAWATAEGEVMAWADGETEPFVLSETGLDDVRVGAVTGTDCSRQADQCTFFVSGHDFDANTTEVFTLTSTGVRGDVDPDGLLLSVSDATDDGRLLGVTSIDELAPSSCSAVLDPAETGSTPLWETCKHTLDTFSPNGDYVLASDSYGDGIGAGVIAVYDAQTGELLADRRNPARAWSSTTAPSGRTRRTSCSPVSRTANGRWSG